MIARYTLPQMAKIWSPEHGFQKWLEMDKDVLGGDYKGHFGAGVADLKPIEKQKDHPILKGITPFKTNGSLYKNPNVASDVTVLVQGYMGKESEPVAWTRTCARPNGGITA